MTDDISNSNNPEQNNAPEEVQHNEEDNIVNLEEEVSALSPDQIIANLEAELVQTKDRTMRALADAENTRKRAMKDRDDAGKYAIANFARDLLDFSDNFRRALESLPPETPEAVRGGLDAMERELQGSFDRHGITKIEPLDEPFDANYHEVMFEAPVPGKAKGIIIQVIEPGYVIKDRLLRAAKVGIAKESETPPADPNADPGVKIDIQG